MWPSGEIEAGAQLTMMPRGTATITIMQCLSVGIPPRSNSNFDHLNDVQVQCPWRRGLSAAISKCRRLVYSH